jgi:hypothetical protein
VRKILPMAAVLALVAAAVVPAPAQVTLSSLTGSSAKTPTTATPSNATTGAMLSSAANISQMLPKYNLSNINQAVLKSGPNPRQFNFTKMLPNFSFINKSLPTKAGKLPPSPTVSNAMNFNNR